MIQFLSDLFKLMDKSSLYFQLTCIAWQCLYIDCLLKCPLVLVRSQPPIHNIIAESTIRLVVNWKLERH